MDSNNKQNKVVVVEGNHDLARIKAIYPDFDVVITNGSEISEETLIELKRLNEERGLVLFLDPDVPGERIRRMINDYVGDTTHAFLPKEYCISKNKKKVGIEHASSTHIKEALDTYKYASTNPVSDLTIQDLYELKLTGHPDAKQRREQLTKTLGIGLANGKTLLTKLRMFQISKDNIIELLRR